MSIEPVAFLPPSMPLTGVASLEGPWQGSQRDAAGLSFVDWLGATAGDANRKLVESEASLQSLAAGENVPLHHVMIGMEEARLGFQLVTQVRSRLLEAYQEVMRMQI